MFARALLIYKSGDLHFLWGPNEAKLFRRFHEQADRRKMVEWISLLEQKWLTRCRLLKQWESCFQKLGTNSTYHFCWKWRSAWLPKCRKTKILTILENTGIFGLSTRLWFNCLTFWVCWHLWWMLAPKSCRMTLESNSSWWRPAWRWT